MQRIFKTLLAVSLLGGCTREKTSSARITSYSNTSIDEVFDTVYSYTEYTDSTETGKKHYNDSLELLEYCNQLFDIYNSYDGINNLKTINDNAGIQPVEVDPLIIDLLDKAKEFHDISEGEFDITEGSLLQVWHRYREAGIALNQDGQYGAVPEYDELYEASQKAGWDKIVIDHDANTVFITEAGVSLDVGGIAKGYAAELAAQREEKDGMKAGFLNVGRNIRLVGEKPDGSNWVIGIADPSGTYMDGIVTIRIDEPVSIVTSGDYERYYIGEDGNRYAHIVDPSTLYPASLYRSVSILTQDSGDADCLSTALFTMTIEEGRELIETYEEKTGNPVHVIWVTDMDHKQTDEGTQVGDLFVTYTDSLEGHLSWPNS
ncbi:MAG: FAD:protein FMN transferase [Bulleidia sp.]